MTAVEELKAKIEDINKQINDEWDRLDRKPPISPDARKISEAFIEELQGRREKLRKMLSEAELDA